MKYPIYKEVDRDLAKLIAEEYNLSLPVAQVLVARGFNVGKILQNYLTPSLKEGVLHPSGLKNLIPAAQLISDFISQGEKIAICCDFDVDGLSSGGLVANFIREIGGEAKIFVPDRFKDGYGLNSRMVRQIAEEGFKIMLTLDYGTTNFTEIDLAKSLGLKTVVVDHHRVGSEIVGADYFVNPCQADCSFADATLCAAGLAWYLCAGIKSIHKNSQEIDLRKYLDFACLGTICDMVPLINVNRVIASKGLYYLRNTENIGLKALLNISGLNGRISSTDVSFILGPRINAAGRMENAEIVTELFTTQDNERAMELARKLNFLNQTRQSTEEKARKIAIERVMEFKEMPKGLVIWDDNFHQGVLGIIAQRLVEKFGCPSIVLAREEAGYKGSVRGVKGFDVYKSLENCKHLLSKYGGHSAAGGLSLSEDNLAKFVESWTEAIEISDANQEELIRIEAESEIMLSDIEDKLISDLYFLEPFGMQNPSPYFYFKNLKVEDVKVLKDTHLKLILSDGKKKIKAVFWKTNSHPDIVFSNRIDLSARVEVSFFSGVKEYQLVIGAIKSTKNNIMRAANNS